MKGIIKFSALIPVYVLIVSFFATSCKHGNQYPKETASLDSVSKALLSVDSLLQKTDSVHIRKCVNNVIIAQDYIKISGTDSMSKGATDILKAYGNTRWELQIFLGRKPILVAEIKKSVDQLNHLSHDLKNGIIKNDSAMIYYNYEMKKASELVEASKYGLQMVKMQLPLNEMISPQADSLVNRLKNHEKI